MPKNAEIFICETCHFKSSRSSNFRKHLSTRKHKILTNPNQIFGANSLEQNIQVFYKKNAENYAEKMRNLGDFSTKNIKNEIYKNEKKFICICGKQYKHNSSLSFHKKKCVTYQNSDKKDELIGKLLKDNAELKKMMCDIIPKISTNTNNIKNFNTINNTNNFNINVFLKETCKDALNITEFVENLNVGVKELEFAKTNGIVEGVSSIIVSNLSNLEVNKRPIHCTDIKQQTLYVKDEDTWDKDNKLAVSRTINDIKDKHIDAIKNWEKENPEWENDKKLSKEYMSLIKQTTDDTVKQNENKILTVISEEVEIKDK